MRATTIPTSILAAAALALGGCGGGDPAEPSTTTVALPPSGSTTTSTTTTAGPPAAPPAAEQPPGPAETATDDPRVNEVERRAARAARDYIEAHRRPRRCQGVRAARSGSLGELEPPRPRGDCAATIEASIGYRDPRGLPVWKSSRAVEVSGGRAARRRATRQGNRDRRDQLSPTATSASIEDDIIYLARVGDRWLVAKPSATLYRAVGVADVPPSVLSPPALTRVRRRPRVTVGRSPIEVRPRPGDHARQPRDRKERT